MSELRAKWSAVVVNFALWRCLDSVSMPCVLVVPMFLMISCGYMSDEVWRWLMLIWASGVVKASCICAVALRVSRSLCMCNVCMLAFPLWPSALRFRFVGVRWS